MNIELPIDINTVKGFLPEDEAEKLYEVALEASQRGPILEIGSYCGKSTIYLGSACKKNGATLFALDHHRGSEEHQVGEEYHDPDLFDNEMELVDTFKAFRTNIRRADLEDTVIPIVAASEVAARQWNTPLAMVFIDGGHSMEAALMDYRSWSHHVIKGGILAIHDIFPNPEDGGRPPFEIWELAKNSGLWEAEPLYGTLGILRKL